MKVTTVMTVNICTGKKMFVPNAIIVNFQR